MTVIAGYVAVLLLAGFIMVNYRRDLKAFERREVAWTEERRELLNRIQAPERVPYQESAPLELPERTEEQIRNDRAWAQVGQVLSIDDSYGLD